MYKENEREREGKTKRVSEFRVASRRVSINQVNPRENNSELMNDITIAMVMSIAHNCFIFIASRRFSLTGDGN